MRKYYRSSTEIIRKELKQMNASKNRISNVENKYYLLPLDEPLGDSMHGIQTHIVLVTTEITTENGDKGVGYTYTGGPGGMAIWQMLESDFKPALLGRDADCIEASVIFL